MYEAYSHNWNKTQLQQWLSAEIMRNLGGWSKFSVSVKGFGMILYLFCFLGHDCCRWHERCSQAEWSWHALFLPVRMTHTLKNERGAEGWETGYSRTRQSRPVDANTNNKPKYLCFMPNGVVLALLKLPHIVSSSPVSVIRYSVNAPSIAAAISSPTVETPLHDCTRRVIAQWAPASLWHEL